MRPLQQLLVVLVTVLLVGCGGGGSGDSDAPGSVTILMGDGPIDDLKEVWITVSELQLNMPGGKDHVVLDEPQTIELLSLRNLTEMLLMEEIVSGRVTKVRLLLDALEIVRQDDSRAMLDVPAGGWIELNPQGGIDVRAGETITLMIDVDLERSMHVVQGGNGEFEFRPQVFVEIFSDGDASRLVRLKGVARGVNSTTGDWDLCDLRREAGSGSSDNLIDCVHIVDDGAAVFENGAELEEGVTVTAFGFMDFAATEDTMLAEILVAGEAQQIETEQGSAVAIADTPPSISIDTDPDPLVETLATANLLSGAKTFQRDGSTTDDLDAGDDVEAFGFRATDSTLGTFLVIYSEPAPVP